MNADDLLLIIGLKEATIFQNNTQIAALKAQIEKQDKQIKKLQAGKSGQKEKK